MPRFARVRECLVFAATAGFAALPGPGQAAAAAVRERLHLAVVVNEVPRPSVHEVLREGTDLYMTAEALRELGLRVPQVAPDGLVPLRGLPGASASYRVETQELRLTVPPGWIEGLPLRLTSGLQPDAAPRPELRVHGLLADYALFAQRAGGSSSLSGHAELRLFSAAPGVWSQGLVTRVVQARGETSHHAVRLDTSWRYDMPDRALSLLAGDTVTRGLAWTRSLRIAGLQFGRDAGLQPYRLTSPLLSVSGEAALPSTVELFINGVRQMEQPVLPGQFQVDAAPTVTGAGTAQLVVTDLNGRVRRVDLDFYAAPSLLRSGAWDGSVEAGFPRAAYGLRSSDYASDPVAMGTLRYGVHDGLTLEGHAEAARGLGMAGAGVLHRLPRQLGLAGAALALSHSPAGTGAQHAFAYQNVGRHASVTATLLRRTERFRDAASLTGSASQRSVASLGTGLRTFAGHLGLGWARQSSFDGGDASVLSASLTKDLAGRSTLQATYLETRAGGRRSRQLALTWSLPLDDHGLLSAGYSRHEGRGAGVVELASAPPAEGSGIAYRLQASADGSRTGAHGQLTGNHRAGHWTAGAMHMGGDAGDLLYAGLDGALLATGGRMHALPRVDDGFAVVSTSGVPGVPVRLENRPAGVSDAEGILLLPRLNAHQRNRVSIDTMGLPEDYRADAVQADAVPERGGGVAVPFGLRRVRPLALTLLDEAGRALPVGTAIEVTGTAGAVMQRTVVGQDGFVYLEDVAEEPVRLRARGSFGACRAQATRTDAAPGGAIVCRSAP